MVAHQMGIVFERASGTRFPFLVESTIMHLFFEGRRGGGERNEKAYDE